MLGVWDVNTIKLDYDDHCTTINIINSLSNKINNSFLKKGTMPRSCFLVTVSLSQGADDHCTTINVINSLSNKKKRERQRHL